MPIETISAIFSSLDHVMYFVPKHHNKVYLKENVEPIMEKMGEIHKDYSKTFNEFFIIVRDKKMPPAELVDLVKQRRLEYEHARVLIKKIAYNWYLDVIDSKKKKIHMGNILNRKFNNCRDEFVKSVVAYFNNGIEISAMENDSWYLNFIEALKIQKQMKWNPWKRVNLIDGWQPYAFQKLDRITNELLPSAWNRLTSAYVKLRRYCY